ncbi:sensor histidine kinase [Sphaerisporangium sp. NPDC005289]|uniref:sensor histidine kinase n=1 Tax=Sphaerisporangium sp. NPDC005289 TaxID=3155247 RepID=UPI0033BF3169
MNERTCEGPDDRPDPEFAAQGPDANGFMIWLVLLIVPLVEVVQGEARPVWVTAPGLSAVAVLYVVTVRLAFTDARRAERLPLPALGALTVWLSLLNDSFILLFPLFAIACGVAVKGMGRVAAVLGAAIVAATGVTAFHDGLLSGGDLDWGSLLALGWGTFTAGLVPAIILRLFEVIAQLRETREELARTAVAEERLRFSRDLHDLLGHTLSVVVVKAEAVRRVLPADIEAAAEQARDIERIGREALAEVRAAVTGYRGRGLAAELASAHAVLSGAGVRLTTRMPVDDLPPETDALLGWAVREGVTNLIRHSGAHTCEITLGSGDNGMVLEIADDGRGGARRADTGHGLRGLRERVRAAGGLLEVDDPPSGGFRLRVTLPREAR